MGQPTQRQHSARIHRAAAAARRNAGVRRRTQRAHRSAKRKCQSRSREAARRPARRIERRAAALARFADRYRAPLLGRSSAAARRCERTDELVAQLELTLRASPPRSIALIGESGVGKTTVVRMLAAKLAKEGWTIFEASANDLVAGQIYIGQLEGRLQSIVQSIARKK